VYIGSASETATGGSADRIKFTDLSLKDLTFGYFQYIGASAAEGNALRVLWNDGTMSGELRLALEGINIDTFEFADGTTLSRIQYNVANGYATLTGTAGNDYIHSGNGNEWIYGGAGNDVLDAGSGTSEQGLYGEAGNDTYIYSKGATFVSITAAAESAASGTEDRVRFTDLSPKDLSFAYYNYGGAEGNALRMLWSVGAQSGELRLSLSGQNIETFEFADGTTLSRIQYNADAAPDEAVEVDNERVAQEVVGPLLAELPRL
jgi:Ca2+-binding RTX toxin-like protein